MSNGKVFNTGNHPVEMLLPMMHMAAAGFAFDFATVTGGPAVLEMWAFPTKDVAVTAFHKEHQAAMNAPMKLDDVDVSLKGYAGIFIPGGHGAMVNLPDSLALGKILQSAHTREMPTITLCHGPGALVAASKVEGAEFPYKGYKMVTFSDKTDAFTPNIGYIPGPMPWQCQDALKKLGAETLNTSETGATYVDRELITGDSPNAANNLGLVATPILVATWPKLK
jgi:molecular chaperone Hsp31 and glyoxalase 3